MVQTKKYIHILNTREIKTKNKTSKQLCNLYSAAHKMQQKPWRQYRQHSTRDTVIALSSGAICVTRFLAVIYIGSNSWQTGLCFTPGGQKLELKDPKCFTLKHLVSPPTTLRLCAAEKFRLILNSNSTGKTDVYVWHIPAFVDHWISHWILIWNNVKGWAGQPLLIMNKTWQLIFLSIKWHWSVLLDILCIYKNIYLHKIFLKPP